MSQSLQHVINELRQLTQEEQWKVLGYLISQFQSTVRFVTNPPTSLQATVTDSPGIDLLLEDTRGSWGNQGLEMIDAQLNRQRQLDWER